MDFIKLKNAFGRHDFKLSVGNEKKKERYKTDNPREEWEDGNESPAAKS